MYHETLSTSRQGSTVPPGMKLIPLYVYLLLGSLRPQEQRHCAPFSDSHSPNAVPSAWESLTLEPSGNGGSVQCSTLGFSPVRTIIPRDGQ